jgi:hypothetical protein
MTKPDEAEKWALWWEAEVRKINPRATLDPVERQAHATGYRYGYRAGQAASAERIKALEAFLKRLREWDQMNPPMTGDHGAFAASIDRLLKEPTSE